MIAATFLQCLLGVGVFLGALGLAFGTFWTAEDLYVKHGYSGWLVVPAAFCVEILIVSTFIWLGTGPLN